VLTGPYAYVAAGAALRDQGYGTIDLTWPGAPSTSNLVAAYMVWSFIDSYVPPAYGTLNGVNVTGTWAAYTTPSPCWTPTYVYTFVAEVTAQVVNGVNNLTSFPSGITNGSNPWSNAPTTPLAEGVALIAIYSSSTATTHQVTVSAGALTAEASGVYSQLSYNTTDGTSATTTYLVADGQFPSNEASWNGTVIDTNAFPGSDPKESSTHWLLGNLSDTKTYAVNVTLGSNNTTAGVIAGGDDCITWVGQVLSVPVPAAPPPYSVVFDEQGLPTGTVWNITTNSVLESGTVVNGSSSIEYTLGNGSYAYSVQPIAGYSAPYNGSILVDGGPVILRLPFHPVLYGVTIAESGLPSGQAWILNFDSQSAYAVTPTIDFQEPNGSYALTLYALEYYTPSEFSGTVTVNGSNVVQTIVYSSTNYPTFPVSFTESGLPVGTNWSMNVVDFVVPSGWTEWTSGTTLNFTEPNGTLNFTVSSAAPGYTPSPSPGSVNVSGVGSSYPITFTPSTTAFSATFSEAGLPNGVTWYVNITDEPGLSATVSGDGGTSLAIDLLNGSYTYTAATDVKEWTTSSGGPFTVSGAPVSQTITFTQGSSGAPVYGVTFAESGLPTGSVWYVNITGEPGLATTVSGSTGTSTSIDLQNDTYSFVAATNAHHWATSSGGPFTVAGAPLTETVTFQSTSASQYAVTFTESGLPSGGSWYINISGQTGLVGQVSGSSGTQLTVSLANGSYSYGAATGWKNWTSSSGTFSLSGSAKGVSVTFTAVGASPPTSSSSFPWAWVIVAIVVVALMLLIALVVYRRRKKEVPPPPGAGPG
jgi:hypothetical protein